MVKVLPQWETSQQMYGGHYSEADNERFRSDRHFTPSGPKSVAEAAVARASRVSLPAVPDMFNSSVPHYGGDHGHQDSEEHMADGLVPEQERDVLRQAHYGKGHEHKDTEDHFRGGSLNTEVNEVETIKTVRVHAGAEMGSDQFLLGVAAIPHQGGGHEDKDTADHFVGGGGFVPDQERTLDGKYGAGHEDLDTLDHFETGTLVPTVEASQVLSVSHSDAMGASNLTNAYLPNYAASDNRWGPKQPTKRQQAQQQRKKRGYQTKKINILGIDTATTRADRLAWKMRKPAPAKRSPARAKSARGSSGGGNNAPFMSVKSRVKSAGLVRSDSKSAVANAANMVRAASAKSGGSRSQSSSRTPALSSPAKTPRMLTPVKARTPKPASASAAAAAAAHHGPGKAEHDVEGFDRLLGAGAHYGGDHKGKDTFSHLEGMVAVDTDLDEKKLLAVGQHYGGGNQNKDTFSNLGPGMVPVYHDPGSKLFEAGDANTTKAAEDVHGQSYGTKWLNEDSRDHFGAGFDFVPEAGAAHFGAVEGDRELGERVPHWGVGHEDKDTASHMKIVNGTLTTEEGVTNADQLYGQHYGADHQNKDTFSNLGHGLIPNARSKFLGAYQTAEEKEAAATRRTTKPKKFKVAYPGVLKYTPHSVDNDVRFRDADLKSTGGANLLPGPAATTNRIRGGYVPGKGVTALGDDRTMRSTRGMVVYPGRAVVKIVNIEDDQRYQRYDGKLGKTTAKVNFPGYAADPNLTTVAMLSESMQSVGVSKKLLDSALVIA